MPRELSAPASPAKPALGPTRSSLGGTAVHWNNATLEQRRFGLEKSESDESELEDEDIDLNVVGS